VTEDELEGKVSNNVFEEIRQYVKDDHRRNFVEYYAKKAI